MYVYAYTYTQMNACIYMYMYVYTSRRVFLDQFLKARKGSQPPTHPPYFYTQKQTVKNFCSVCVNR